MKGAKEIDRLIARAKAADKEALGELYDTLLPRVYRFVFFRVRRREDAEDIAEQVFVNVLTHIRSYDERGLPFEAWVFRITRNMIIDHYRLSNVKSVPLEEAQDLPDAHPTPEEVVEQKLTYEAVLAVLPRLPDTYQEIIILKFIEDRENEEISLLLDKPVDQIRVLQSRALARLKRELSL